MRGQGEGRGRGERERERERERGQGEGRGTGERERVGRKEIGIHEQYVITDIYIVLLCQYVMWGRHYSLKWHYCRNSCVLTLHPL